MSKEEVIDKNTRDLMESVKKTLILTHKEYASKATAEKKFEAAANSYKEITNLSPGDAVAHADLGRALVTLKRYGEAMEAYKTSLFFDPNNSGVQRAFNDTLSAIAQETIKSKLPQFERENTTLLQKAASWAYSICSQFFTPTTAEKFIRDCIEEYIGAHQVEFDNFVAANLGYYATSIITEGGLSLEVAGLLSNYTTFGTADIGGLLG